jgi:hypothetical protein
MKRLMKAFSLVAVFGCLASAGAAFAETLVMNDQVQLRDSSVERPTRGSTMEAVEARFGAPAQKHATVGGGHPGQPPITRWDYPHFSVFFERDRVIHAVVTGG